MNEDFLLAGEEREADDEEFPPNDFEDQWEVDEPFRAEITKA